MKILVTGAEGFIGKNLISTLNNISEGKDKTSGITSEIFIYQYDVDSTMDELNSYCSECDFVFHLAGVNRPKEQNEFMEGNFGFTSKLLDTLVQHNNNCPIVLASSIQAELDNLYGRSKKAGEELLFEYGKKTGAAVYVYRYPNVFGKWCRPNYNSAVATFCHNIANDLPIQVNDRNTVMSLVYIDDVVRELVAVITGNMHINQNGYCEVPKVYSKTLGEIADLLYSFKKSRNDVLIPDMTEEGFAKLLYATYVSYLPLNKFGYFLKMNKDERGSFTELFRTADRGQVSVNIIKPEVVKGNHWHHTKTEKFVVVSGKGVIRFRKMDARDIIEYHVSGEKIEVIDIPTGYTHSIMNEGDTELVTIMWCSECFNPEQPDTYFLNVDEEE